MPCSRCADITCKCLCGGTPERSCGVTACNYCAFMPERICHECVLSQLMSLLSNLQPTMRRAVAEIIITGVNGMYPSGTPPPIGVTRWLTQLANKFRGDMYGATAATPPQPAPRLTPQPQPIQSMPGVSQPVQNPFTPHDTQVNPQGPRTDLAAAMRAAIETGTRAAQMINTPPQYTITPISNPHFQYVTPARADPVRSVPPSNEPPSNEPTRNEPPINKPTDSPRIEPLPPVPKILPRTIIKIPPKHIAMTPRIAESPIRRQKRGHVSSDSDDDYIDVVHSREQRRSAKTYVPDEKEIMATILDTEVKIPDTTPADSPAIPKPADSPADSPADNPADNPADKPADPKPANKPRSLPPSKNLPLPADPVLADRITAIKCIRDPEAPAPNGFTIVEKTKDADYITVIYKDVDDRTYAKKFVNYD